MCSSPSLSTFSITHRQLWSKHIKWKILETVSFKLRSALSGEMEPQGPPQPPGRERPLPSVSLGPSLPAGDQPWSWGLGLRPVTFLHLMLVPLRKVVKLRFRGASEEPGSSLQAERGESTGESIGMRIRHCPWSQGPRGCVVYPGDCCCKDGLHVIAG